jgi:hypothetical protein
MIEGTPRFGWRYAVILGAIAILGRILLLPILPHPKPRIHDEFSYLLAAETFAAGKLSNPPHAKAKFFETFHVLSRPRYMSKYPPGQAAFLALGILAGHPHYGVILTFGLFVMTTVWMLQSIVPLKWALFGGVWAFLTFNIQSYWLESYWGGFVAATGGNLVLGSLLSCFLRERMSARWCFVPGALLLAVTRPFEGMAFVVTAFTAFFIWKWLANQSQFLKYVKLWVAPALVAVALVGTTVGVYNWRTLGSPLRFPYVEYEKQYGLVPVFWPLPLRNEMSFDDPMFEKFYRHWSVDGYQQARAHVPALLLPLQMLRIGIVGIVSVFGFSTSVIAMALVCWRKTIIRVLTGVLLVTSLFVALEVWILPHYLAPQMGLIIALGVTSLCEICTSVRKGGGEPRITQFIIVLALVAPVIQSIRFLRHATRDGVARGLPFDIQYREQPRDLIKTALLQAGGNHVVFIRYSPSHDVHEEWVYNSPDIDSQSVIWARDRRDEDRTLKVYYPDRTFWLLEPDTASPQLQLMTDLTR